MDHVISFISEYMQHDIAELTEEWTSGEYRKLSECPSYPEVKAYCEARNILAKQWDPQGYISTSPKKEVDYWMLLDPRA